MNDTIQKNILKKIIESTKPKKSDSNQSDLTLKAALIDTPIGQMIAISDDKNLCLLEFTDRRNLEQGIKSLKHKARADIIEGDADPISMIRKELELYFTGKLKSFSTPLKLMGSDFQDKAWHALTEIPYGQTRSYKHQAKIIGNEKASRAVASANGANQLAIIIPCHRIINSDGNLGGYAGGIDKKEWLIKHEASNA